MKGFRHIVTVMALLALGAVMTGCGVFVFPHDRGMHRGEYERDRGAYQGRDHGDRHDRGRDHRGDRDHRD